MDLFGFTLIPNNLVPQLTFIGFSMLAIFASVMMITRTNAVHSALWLVVVFFQIAGAYVLLNAPFLAALQVLVYTGAILVLFLFVIMLLQMREGPQLAELHKTQRFLSWPVGILLAVELCTIILLSRTLIAQPIPANTTLDNPGGTAALPLVGAWTQPNIEAAGGAARALGIDLYTDFLLPFEVASMILLVGVVGAIILAGRADVGAAETSVPSVGITLGRRSVYGTPQDEQFDREVRPEITGHASAGQPSGNGNGAAHAQDPVRGEVVSRK